ncbi:MAG: protein-export chaperone SecB [Alphaproteobacteria bacterium]|nr:protein-export chaperone SecB [Alphaproteobacteria bacterium]
MTDAPTTPEAGAQPQMPSLRILSQYVKDLSFENPGAPESMRGAGAPNIDMGIDVQARSLGQDTFEVVLNFSARAVRGEDEVVFIAELAYGGLFQMTNVSDADREPFLLIECPRLIFPFARRILADITRDGGFPPLMLDPVDFANLYRAQLAKRAAAAQGSEGNGNGEPAVN